MKDFDSFYTALEDRFRGSFDTIKQRARVYLEELPTGKGLAALDLGCGRGEWLELLTERGIAARGVDSNRKFASAGSARGLDITIGDLFDVAATLPSRSFDVVSAFHVIEHLPMDKQLQLLSEAHRLLRPNGIFIAEWPNIRNFEVISSTFWLDPTHARPLPAELVQFMAEYSGFDDVSLRTLERSVQELGQCQTQERQGLVKSFLQRMKASVQNDEVSNQQASRAMQVLVDAVNVGMDTAIIARRTDR